MRVVIQRVAHASVEINHHIKSKIGKGLVVLLGIEGFDTEEDIDWLTRKMINMRIFPDREGVMNRSLLDVEGDLMIVSQFTLHASTKKGNRPSYIKAAPPDVAIPLYEKFVSKAEQELGRSVATGEFGADMQVSLQNDGPVTIWMDSRNKE